MTFTEALGFILIAAVTVGLALLAIALIRAAWHLRAERTYAELVVERRAAVPRRKVPLFPLFEDTEPLPACFQCLSDDAPRQTPPIAKNGPSAVQWADTPAYRGVERRAQSRSSLRPVWTPEQRRLVEDATGRHLESEGEESE